MIEYVPFQARGAVRDLFYCRDQEVLLEGPAGTGKTRGLLEYVYWLCTEFPGVRVLLLRKTRASLTESAMVTWESKVIPDDACMRSGGSGITRHSYSFPWASNEVGGKTYQGRSRVVLGGMDKSSRVMSTEYDVICVIEARELTESEWQALLTRCRNWHLPWQQIIADTNPDHPAHWLNQRAARPRVLSADVEAVFGKVKPGEKQMRRLVSRHRDNPALWDAEKKRWTREGAVYMAKLESLRGADRGRWLMGEWVGAEGQVWEVFDREKHMVYREALDENGKVPEDGHRRDKEGRLTFDWYFGSFDWGHRAPGCFQVWGVVGKAERIYRIHEIYRRAFPLDAWAEQVCKYWKRYELTAVVCDPSRPDLIDMLNRRLIEVGARNTPHLVIPGLQDVNVRIDTVRYGFAPAEGQGDGVLGIPKLYLCWDANELVDLELQDDHKAWSTETEIPGLVWAAFKDGKPLKEEPDPTVPNHGCDATGYAAVYAFGKDLTAGPKKPSFDPDSLGAILGHDQVRLDAA